MLYLDPTDKIMKDFSKYVDFIPKNYILFNNYPKNVIK